jgi:hypothetical protein
MSLQRSSGAGTAPGSCWNPKQLAVTRSGRPLKLPSRLVVCRDGVGGPSAAGIVSSILDKVQGTGGLQVRGRVKGLTLGCCKCRLGGLNLTAVLGDFTAECVDLSHSYTM